MARKQHTIILVPHARAKLRKWRVTNLQIGLAAGVFLLLTFAALFVTWSYFRTSASPVEIARLEAENRKLRGVNSSFESSLRTLQEQLAEQEDRTRQLAIIAGLESLGDGEAGIGGPVGEPSAEGFGATGAIDAMADRSVELAGRLDQVEARLEQRLRWISATPAVAPVRGILTSGFGSRNDPLTHGRGQHEGVDIAAPPGQPVLAPADGVVIRAGALGGLGNAVHLAHGFGLTTRYGHLARIDVKPGQRVRRGELLGRVGSTGRSTGYHLHYEVHVDGQAVNPLGYMLEDSSGL